MVPLSRQLWRVPSSENIIERWNNCTHLNLACDPKLSKIWIRIPIKIKVGSEFKKSFGFFLNFIGVANHLLLLNIFEVMSKLIIISDFSKMAESGFAWSPMRTLDPDYKVRRSASPDSALHFCCCCWFRSLCAARVVELYQICTD